MRLGLAADVLLALGACQIPNVRKPLPGVGALGSQACGMCGMGRLGGCSGVMNLTDNGKYILRGSVHGHASCDGVCGTSPSKRTLLGNQHLRRLHKRRQERRLAHLLVRAGHIGHFIVFYIWLTLIFLWQLQPPFGLCS